MKESKKIHYRRRFSYHPLPPGQTDARVDVLRWRTKRYPYSLGVEFWGVACRAINVLADERPELAGVTSDLYGELLAEFFAFRRKVFRTIPDPPAEHDRDRWLSEREHALDIMWNSDPWSELDEHLDTLRLLWLSPERPISSDDPLSLGIVESARAPLLGRHYAIAAMRYAELAILASASGAGVRAMGYAMKACSTSYCAQDLMFDNEAEAIRKQASRGGKARHRVDPKQRAKAEVYAMWLKWQSGDERHKNQSKFALAAVGKHADVLESTQTIERWQRSWRVGKDIPGDD